MMDIPLHYSIPAYIATNQSTGICNVYDHLPQLLDNGDYAGNIILTLGVKGVGQIPDRINYWSLQGIELPVPGTKPIRISLDIDLSDHAHPINGTDTEQAHIARPDDSSEIAVDPGGHSMADPDTDEDDDDNPFSKDNLAFIFEGEIDC